MEARKDRCRKSRGGSRREFLLLNRQSTRDPTGWALSSVPSSPVLMMSWFALLLLFLLFGCATSDSLPLSSSTDPVRSGGQGENLRRQGVGVGVETGGRDGKEPVLSNEITAPSGEEPGIFLVRHEEEGPLSPPGRESALRELAGNLRGRTERREDHAKKDREEQERLLEEDEGLFEPPGEAEPEEEDGVTAERRKLTGPTVTTSLSSPTATPIWRQTFTLDFSVDSGTITSFACSMVTATLADGSAATLTNLQTVTANSRYTCDVTMPTTDGPLSVSIAANTITDGTNANSAATGSLSVVYYYDPPTVTASLDTMYNSEGGLSTKTVGNNTLYFDYDKIVR
eukprot:Cvel_31838.t1-p1 / transcript=Cvel_31838.t1 / gene=Cvel_31838 / organism=Chromera_velia_CCMP2878 / gene_product=hypothetical protein / transcript_product=hypothetical protein / location=Cvel_scaffold4816:125-2151(-) / protein_length=341 / sequence_SO=supercontig / SO=protein_coding / is_pseudo=false